MTIKFRGISIDTGKMVYGDLLQYCVYPVIFDENREQHEVDAKTVGQFTGLKDVKGVEIFEGDVVVESSYPMFNDGLCNYRCVVIWDDTEACFGLDMYCVSDRVRGSACPNSISEYKQLEVIGSVHTNPELIGGVK